jgi:molecular chaperone DnaK (HSP70)
MAYCDGTRIRVLTEQHGVTPFIPTAVSYRNGRPRAFGREAREEETDISVTSLKWELTKDRQFDIGDESRGKTAEEVVTDFAGFLRGILRDNRVDPEEHDIAVTIPVGYPLSARRKLIKAFGKGGLNVKGVFPEPVSALYAVLASNQREGYSAIFDWGGGTLDIATLQVKGNRAYVLSTEGMKEGGDDFDEWIAKDALEMFLSGNPGMEKDREHLWMNRSRGLLLRAERTKWDFSRPIRWDSFVGKKDLEYRLDVPCFEERLTGSIEKAVSLFRRAIRIGGGTERLVKPVILSGGTRNLDFLRRQLETEFGDKIIDRLPQASYFLDLAAARIDSATAIGATLLMANRSRPVFSKSLGIRLADARSSSSSDLFCTVFKKGGTVDYNKPVSMDFHVTNPSGGVAYLMVCEQLNEETEPAGTLLRVLPFPVDSTETRVTAKFSITEDLLLRIKVTGAIARVRPEDSEFYVPIHNFGFDLPPVL